MLTPLPNDGDMFPEVTVPITDKELGANTSVPWRGGGPWRLIRAILLLLTFAGSANWPTMTEAPGKLALVRRFLLTNHDKPASTGVVVSSISLP